MSFAISQDIDFGSDSGDDDLLMLLDGLDKPDEEKKEVPAANETKTVEVPEKTASSGQSAENSSKVPEASSPKEDPIVAQYEKSIAEKKDDETPSYKYPKQKTVAPARRPSVQSSDKTYNDKSENYEAESLDVFKYGLEEQISTLIDELTKNEDTRFVDSIYDLFFVTRDMNVKNKILTYFTKLKDPCLGNYACEVINDPYDTKKEIVESCFRYVSEVKIAEAVPGLVDLVDKEEDDYFTGALAALGETGGTDEAEFLVNYLDRKDLSVMQKQSLMKVLGRIKALETWEKLCEIAQNDDENAFVRMYAAEAIGAMEKSESEEILLKLFESDDPNFRCYVIKGLSHFDSEKTKGVIVQALRDSQYKVRLEAIHVVEEKGLQDAIPYIIYRCKDKKEEVVVKDKCYKVIAKLNCQEGNAYLVDVLKDRHMSDSTKIKVASALLENGTSCVSEIVELAKTTFKNDIHKTLRYGLGKEFAKYANESFSEICLEYLNHKDVQTQGTGLDIFAKGRYGSCLSKVQEIAKDAYEEEAEKAKASEEEESGAKKKPAYKKRNANSKKAKRILESSGISSGKSVDAVSSGN